MFPIYLLKAHSCSGMVGFATAPNPIVHSTRWETDSACHSHRSGMERGDVSRERRAAQPDSIAGNKKLKQRKKAFNSAPQTLRSMKWVGDEERPNHHGWAAAGKSKALRRRLGKVIRDLFHLEQSFCSTLLFFSWEGSITNCFFIFSFFFFPWKHTKCCNAQQCGNNTCSSLQQMWL